MTCLIFCFDTKGVPRESDRSQTFAHQTTPRRFCLFLFCLHTSAFSIFSLIRETTERLVVGAFRAILFVPDWRIIHFHQKQDRSGNTKPWTEERMGKNKTNTNKNCYAGAIERWIGPFLQLLSQVHLHCKNLKYRRCRLFILFALWTVHPSQRRHRGSWSASRPASTWRVRGRLMPSVSKHIQYHITGFVLSVISSRMMSIQMWSANNPLPLFPRREKVCAVFQR